MSAFGLPGYLLYLFYTVPERSRRMSIKKDAAAIPHAKFYSLPLILLKEINGFTRHY